MLMYTRPTAIRSVIPRTTPVTIHSSLLRTIAGDGPALKPHLAARVTYPLASVCHLNSVFLGIGKVQKYWLLSEVSSL